MHRLSVLHVSESDPPQFQVQRDGGRMAPPAEVPSSYGFPVEGRPNSDLACDIHWYLEDFLNYPFPPRDRIAERVQDAFRRWGTQAFEALFSGGRGRDFYRDATRDGLPNLYLEVVSDDPTVLAWPWEALYDPDRQFIVHNARIARRLNQGPDPLPLPDDLPRGRVNILLVTARPFESDVAYRSISRPLVELIEAKKLPAAVHVLRPPTFEQLRAHLREHPAHYHIVHFDGHGGYGAQQKSSRYTLRQKAQGHLIFEDEDGQPNPVSAEKLSQLLQEFRIPVVVLNACQSGMVDGNAEDAFASVAAAMIRAGVRGVVAMAYSLYVSGATEYLPAFYSRLFETGDLAEAVRAGRQRMLERPSRLSARGQFELDDWLVPVLYAQEDLDFSFAAEPAADDDAVSEEVTRPDLPEEAQDRENPYGFIGRDRAILELERAMRRKPAGILIQGLGGVGKTTLVRGFLHWLRNTGGLLHQPSWFTFNDIRSAEHVLNQMGMALFGTAFGSLKRSEKLDRLTHFLRKHPFVIVWDNFESAAGVEGTTVKAMLSDEDRRTLQHFLEQLRGGQTKVLLTSRSDERWLPQTACYRLPLGGLQGEERWEFCTEILSDLGLTVDWGDQDFAELMNLLDGHPLAMRVVLPLVAERSAAQVAQALRENVAALGLDGEDDVQGKLFATLGFVEEALPGDLRPLLVPLALHERYVSAHYLEAMAKKVDEAWTRERIDAFIANLATAGLLRDRGQTIYEIHPVLTGFLHSQTSVAERDEAWTRAFTWTFFILANHYASKPPPEQRVFVAVHEANLYNAAEKAERLEMWDEHPVLLQLLALRASDTHDLQEAERLLQRRAATYSKQGREEDLAITYHQLGEIAL